MNITTLLAYGVILGGREGFSYTGFLYINLGILIIFLVIFWNIKRR